MSSIRLNIGIVTKQWKETNVTALHKKGDTNQAPISLTCVACRVLEYIVADSIKNHLSDRIFEGQQGFTAKKSTNLTQVFETYEDWVDSLDASYCIDIISTYFPIIVS